MPTFTCSPIAWLKLRLNRRTFFTKPPGALGAHINGVADKKALLTTEIMADGAKVKKSSRPVDGYPPRKFPLTFPHRVINDTLVLAHGGNARFREMDRLAVPNFAARPAANQKADIPFFAVGIILDDLSNHFF